jgi:tetratricopeptide (TPR) repeat protein
VLEKHPDQAITWRNLALALSGAGSKDEAIEAYKRSLTRAPNDTQTLFDYALALAQAGRSGSASEILDRLLRIDDSDSDARELRKWRQSSPNTPPHVQHVSIPQKTQVFNSGSLAIFTAILRAYHRL